MTRSTPAIVEPSVLNWARVSAGYSLDEAAQKLQTKTEQLEKWERGEVAPSIAKVRSMSRVYKRPLHFFFLEQPPVDPPIPHDFRRLPADGVSRYEPSLRFQVRAAYERRQTVLDLASDIDEPLQQFPLKASLRISPDSVGQQIRTALGVTLADQKRMRRESYRFWRSRIEAIGVLVFQVTGIPTKKMLGFSLSFEVLPVIGVNRKLKTNGRVFTLLHEFAHLMLGENGICDLTEEHLGSPQDERTEVFANAVAASTLIPREALLAEQVIIARGPGEHDWSNNELDALAQTYGVSEETVLRRLLTIGRTSRLYYQRKRREYLARYERLEQLERADAADQDFKRNMPQEVLSDFGRFYSRVVLQNYALDRITLTDASNLLGVKAPMVERVEKLLWERS